MDHCKVAKFCKLPSWPFAELSPFPALLFSKRSTASLPKQTCSIHISGGIFSFTTPHSISAFQTSINALPVPAERIIKTCHGMRWHHRIRNTSPETPAETRRDEEGLKVYTQTNKCNDGEKPSRRLQHAKLCMLEAPHWSKERGVQAIIRTKLQKPPLSSNIGPILRFCSAI